MRAQYWKLGLIAACVFSLWLMVFFLSLESSQKHLHNMDSIQSRTCHCSRNPSRECHCLQKAHQCSACLHIPGESDWFDSRFERAIEPLERSEDSMAYDALVVWLDLHRLTSEKEVASKQLTDVSPRRALGNVGSSCWTCAVVGNSRSLRGSGLGFIIDQHDMVLRMNLAPVKGFETDVGNKTSMFIMYPEMANAEAPDTQLLLLPFNSSALQWIMNVLHKDNNYILKPRNPGYQIFQFSGGTKENRDKVRMINLSFLRYIQEHWLENQGQYPSLGFVALVYALHTCDQVSLFGFGTDRLKMWSHYWDDGYLFEDVMQMFPEEEKVIYKLQCEGKVADYSRNISTGGPPRQTAKGT